MSQKLWVGLDVGAEVTALCIVDHDGRVRLERILTTDASLLDSMLRPEKRRIQLISVESSSSAIPLTRSLIKLGYRVALFETRQASKFLALQRNKTDKNDARGLAQLGRIGRGSVSEVRVKSVECQRVRSMLVTRRKMVSLRVTIDGIIRSLLRLNGGRLKSSSSATRLRSNVTDELKRIRKLRKIDLTEDIQPILALAEGLRTYLEKTDQKLSKMALDHPVCRSFLSIKGVGPLCALSFYSSVEDPQRFTRNTDVGPFLGLVPTVRQSGTKTSTGRISKMGDCMTRSYLVTAGQQHLRHGNSTLSDWGSKLAERAGSRKARVAVGRKLAVLMISIWKSQETYDPQRGQLREASMQMSQTSCIATPAG